MHSPWQRTTALRQQMPCYHDTASVSHGLSVLYCIVVVGICTASGMAGHSLSAVHRRAVQTQCPFAWHSTSVPLLHCTALEMRISWPSPSYCTTAAVTPPSRLSHPVRPLRCQLVSFPRFLLAAPVEQHLCFKWPHCSVPLAPTAHCPRSR